MTTRLLSKQDAILCTPTVRIQKIKKAIFFTTVAFNTYNEREIYTY